VLVGPLDAPGDDTAVGGLLIEIRHFLVQRVGRFELAPVESRAVTDHNLRRVLVGHDDRGLRELRTHRIRVVSHQRLLSHADVVVLLLSISFSIVVQKRKERMKQFRKFKSDQALFARITY